MNNKGINLLVDRRSIKPTARIKTRLGLFRLGAIFVLFGTGFISVILSILIVFSPLPQLQKEEQNAKDSLAIFGIDINKLAFINDRGNSIRKILKKRPSYDKKIDTIQSKLPPGVTFDGFTIDKQKYTYTFSSDNLASIDELLNSIVAITGKGRDYTRIYLTSISTNEEDHKFVVVIDLISV